jgi:hypothetical protein
MLEYNTEHDPEILTPIAEQINKLMEQYIAELKEEQNDANK